MTATTQQKQDLRREIIVMIARYLDIYPHETRAVAIGACRRLAANMTLKELEVWHEALLARSGTGNAE